MAGHPAYPDKVIMRVHASLRDDVRLCASAAGGAVILFTVIVFLGFAPSPFPSVNAEHRPSSPTVVLPALDAAAAYRHRAAVHTSLPRTAAKPTHVGRPQGSGRVVAQPAGPTTRRSAPTPVRPAQAPEPKPSSSSPSPAPSAPNAPASGSPSDDASVATPQLPTVPADPVPSLPVPSLPTVTVPTVEVPTVTVPSVTLP